MPCFNKYLIIRHRPLLCRRVHGRGQRAKPLQWARSQRNPEPDGWRRWEDQECAPGVGRPNAHNTLSSNDGVCCDEFHQASSNTLSSNDGVCCDEFHQASSKVKNWSSASRNPSILSFHRSRHPLLCPVCSWRWYLSRDWMRMRGWGG